MARPRASGCNAAPHRGPCHEPRDTDASSIVIRPLPPHSSHRGANTRCPGTTGFLTLATPVPPQAGQCFSLMPGARVCARVCFDLVMIQSPRPHIDGFPLARECARRALGSRAGSRSATPCHPRVDPGQFECDTSRQRREQRRADAAGASRASYRPLIASTCEKLVDSALTLRFRGGYLSRVNRRRIAP